MLDKLKYLIARTGERAVKTFCQTEAAILTASGVGLLNADWQASLSAAGMAALLSVLTTVGTDALAKPDAPLEPAPVNVAAPAPVIKAAPAKKTTARKSAPKPPPAGLS